MSLQSAVVIGRGAYIDALWTPATTDMLGKPRDKPQYSISIIVPKTAATWFQEPALSSVKAACAAVYIEEFQPKGFLPLQLTYPVRDGDLPNAKGHVVEWQKGHWVFRLSSTIPGSFAVSGAIGGQTQVMPAATIGGTRPYDNGDEVLTEFAVKKSPQKVGVSFYLGSVHFQAKRAKIDLGGVKSTPQEMLAKAQAQGLVPPGASPGVGAAAPGTIGGAAVGADNPFG